MRPPVTPTKMPRPGPAPLWIAPQIPGDGRQPVTVTFSEPGTYVLRCRADDGALLADEEVTIVVTR